MKQISLILLLFVTACKSQQLPPEKIVEKEVVRTEYIEKLRDTIIYITLPTEEKERFTPDSTSFLKIRYAESTCEIRNGLLFHKVVSTQDKIPIDVTVRDTEKQNNSIRTVVKEKPYLVPAENTKWEVFYMQVGKIIFWVIIIAVFAIIGYFVGRKLLKRYLPFNTVL